MTGEKILKNILYSALKDAGVFYETENSFPVILRKGKNDFGKTVGFYLNYSAREQSAVYELPDGRELLTGKEVKKGERISLAPWNLRIIETKE